MNVLGLNNVIQKLVTLTLAVVEPVASLEKIDKLGQSESEYNFSVLIKTTNSKWTQEFIVTYFSYSSFLRKYVLYDFWSNAGVSNSVSYSGHILRKKGLVARIKRKNVSSSRNRRLKVPLYYKNSSFSNKLSNFNDVVGRVFETPDIMCKIHRFGSFCNYVKGLVQRLCGDSALVLLNKARRWWCRSKIDQKCVTSFRRDP